MLFSFLTGGYLKDMLFDSLKKISKKYPENIAIEFNQHQINYEKLLQIIYKLANGFLNIGIKKGDRIVTSGGIHGRITGMDDVTLTVEIADKVRVKVARGNVSAMAQSAAQSQPAKK